MTVVELPGFAFDPLTPVRFLERSARVFPGRVAVVDGAVELTYAQLLDRCERWAGALRSHGVQRGDRVAVLAPNSHLLLEAHTGPALCGAVLVALNTRLAPAEIARILDHARPTVFLVHPSLEEVGRSAAERAGADVAVTTAADFEQWLADAQPLHEQVGDEAELLSLNYTSGTTGTPKGVMYHHRGAFLQALAMVIHARLDARTAYLWTLPMFHCNGWAFTWAVTAAGGTHVCLPQVDPAEAWRLIHEEGVTHFCAAPTVLTMLGASQAARPVEDRTVRAFVGGAPPTPALLEEMEDLGIDVTHLYGLTESFGPAVLCEWHPEWDDLPASERAELTARQGVGNVLGGEVRVVDEAGDDVPHDATTIGEILLRGNALMAGYFEDAEATAAATFEDRWFRTGDLAVVQDDGYVDITDRAKDIIISGGENVSSIEVERVLARHPAVLEAAVVGVPHQKWGERPRAHVTLRDGASATEQELRDHVREYLAGFKVPDQVMFGELPKTSTGKVQKHVLREN